MINFELSVFERGASSSESTLNTWCLFPITLVLTVVIRFSLFTMPSALNFSLFKRTLNFSAALSFPITEQRIGLAPNAFKFKATFAAPPKRLSFLFTETIGTGASGEIRLHHHSNKNLSSHRQ